MVNILKQNDNGQYLEIEWYTGQYSEINGIGQHIEIDGYWLVCFEIVWHWSLYCIVMKWYGPVFLNRSLIQRWYWTDMFKIKQRHIILIGFQDINNWHLDENVYHSIL